MNLILKFIATGDPFTTIFFNYGFGKSLVTIIVHYIYTVFIDAVLMEAASLPKGTL